MTDRQFADKFGTIMDLPVSEEMLGAYLEGRLDEAESRYVSDSIESDLALMNLVHGVSEIEIPEDDYFFSDAVIDNLELPLIIDVRHPELALNESDSDLDDNGFVFQAGTDDYLDEDDTFDTNINDEY